MLLHFFLVPMPFVRRNHVSAIPVTTAQDLKVCLGPVEATVIVDASYAFQRSAWERG